MSGPDWSSASQTKCAPYPFRGLVVAQHEVASSGAATACPIAPTVNPPSGRSRLGDMHGKWGGGAYANTVSGKADESSFLAEEILEPSDPRLREAEAFPRLTADQVERVSSFGG